MGLLKKAMVAGGVIYVAKNYQHGLQRNEVQQHQDSQSSARGTSFDDLQEIPSQMVGHQPYCNGRCGGRCTESTKYDYDHLKASRAVEFREV
jgi:hypothetical protein